MELLDLSNEPLDSVLAQIPFNVFCPRTIYHVMLTCRRLSNIAMPLLYSRLAFNFKHTGIKLIPNSPNPFNKYDKMLELHPERASWAVSASFTYSWSRPDIWINIASILPRLSLLRTLKIGAGLGYIYPFADNISLGIDGRDPQTIINDGDSEFIRLLKRCDHLHSLHTVCLMDRCITLQEARAFFALPKIRVLEMRILDDIYPSLNDHLTVPEPSKLTVFKLVSELLPRNRIANQLFKSLSALQDLYWSTEDPQPYVSFIVPVPPPQDTWSPKEVEQTISPCKGTISRLELYNTLSWQRIILPNIEFLDFPALKVLKISGRIMFANALASTYPDGVLAASRDHFSKRLPRSLENLEIRFHKNESILDLNSEQARGHEWLLDLSSSKDVYCPKLKSVTLVEDVWKEWSQQRTWEYPADVQEAYSAASIVLVVIMRALPDTS